MREIMGFSSRRPSVALVLAGLLGLVTMAPASATNEGTEPGVVPTDQCEVTWEASAILSLDLTIDDPESPNLMVDLEGEPVGYQNGGYIKEVSPVYGHPGLLEVNHFYIPQSSLQVWRIPTATFDHAISSASVTFTVPEEVASLDLPVTFDAASANGVMSNWGSPYDSATWSQQANAVDNQDGTWTVELGDLPRNHGTVFQFNVDYSSNPESFTSESRHIASAVLTGEYPAGEGDCPLPVPLSPDEDESEGTQCIANFYGETYWSIYDRDITRRTKFF